MRLIVEDIQKVVDLVRADTKLVNTAKPVEGAPFYMYGHIAEINQRLSEKGQDKEKKYKKYPLIALVLDIEEDVVNNVQEYNDLRILIVHSTNSNYVAEERTTNVFKPVLHPLYLSFMRKLKSSGLFMWPQDSLENPPHKRIDRYYYGKTNDIHSNSRSLKKAFIDPLDAVEIKNLKLKQNINLCK